MTHLKHQPGKYFWVEFGKQEKKIGRKRRNSTYSALYLQTRCMRIYLELKAPDK
jgi:hypothetical protein